MRSPKQLKAISIAVTFAAMCVATIVWPYSDGRQAQSAESSLQNFEYRFAYRGNAAAVPAEMVCERLFVPVRVNQAKPALFAVDTANANSALYTGSAAQTGVTPSGPVQALLALPGLEMKTSGIAAADLSSVSALVGSPVQGIFGADVLGRFIVEIDYDRSSIIFRDANAFQYGGKGQIVPLVIRNGVPSVHAKISLPGSGAFEDEFDIQTAYSGSVAISHSYIVAHHLHTSHMRAFRYPEAAGSTTLVTRAKAMTFGSFVLDNAIVEFPDEHSSVTTSSAMIGNAILKKFRVILDVPHQRMILESNSSYPNDVDYDKSGVHLVASGANWKTFQVAGVASHSPGSEAGLQTGDIIAGIDNQPAADLSLSEIYSMFRQTHDYKLTVLRHDKTIDLKLKTRRLV